MQLKQSLIEETVQLALTEDIGKGDVTSRLINSNEISLAFVTTREDAIMCGIDWFDEVYRQINPQIFIEWNTEDGEQIQSGQTLCTISGPARGMLSGERTALNFLQTLSATATMSYKYAHAVENTGATILDTRKTIPCLRQAQKYAVSIGGCENHRMGLFDAVLIKENHIIACGGIEQAIEAASTLNPGLDVEIEVENNADLQRALDAGAKRVLLDNFDTGRLIEAVRINDNRALLEASGGVTLDNIREIADTGVNYISTGALTKDIAAIDLSMIFNG